MDITALGERLTDLIQWCGWAVAATMLSLAFLSALHARSQE